MSSAFMGASTLASRLVAARYRMSIGLKENAETQALGAAVCSGFVEPLDELSAVRLDHAPRCDVVGICGQLDVCKSLFSCLGKQQLQGSRCVSPPALPWDYRIADVSQTMWREFGRAGLPSEADRTAEFSIPHPSRVPGQPRNG